MWFDPSDVLDVNFQPKIFILLQGEGSGIRGSAHQIVGRVDSFAHWGWIHLAIRQRWPDFGSVFLIEGKEVVTEHQKKISDLDLFPVMAIEKLVARSFIVEWRTATGFYWLWMCMRGSESIVMAPNGTI